MMNRQQKILTVIVIDSGNFTQSHVNTGKIAGIANFGAVALNF
jgi:hypothetical protein